MKKVLFDTNIILDIALKREPFFEDSQQLFLLIDQNKIVGNISATTITDIYYIAKKEKSHNMAISFINNLIELVEIIGIDKLTIKNALASGMKEVEDAIQSSAAEINDIDVIITRNKNDFTHSSVKVLTPNEFLSNLSK